ncbi:MAG: ribonuclease D [Aggregatilineales bacterium]
MSPEAAAGTIVLPEPVFVTTTEHLRALAAGWQHAPLIALDTESNSLYAYRERICLVQLSTRQADYVIDPLTVDLEPLRALFANPAIEKVFHAAEYDLICLKREYHFTIENVFDTMFAARVIGRKQYGLAALLQEFFDVQTDKHFQRADWSRRPLPIDQIRYAQQDTHYLALIRDRLLAELEAEGRLAEARELFEALTAVEPGEISFDEDGYWRMAGARDFNRRQMAQLRELYLWRDSQARRADCPPFKIMSDQALIGLVEANPHSPGQIYAVRALPPSLARRYSRELLQVLARGVQAPLPRRPESPPRVEPIVQARYDALQQWRKARAIERGVESDIILNKEAMWAMARRPPMNLTDLESVPGLGPWRRNAYAAELIRVVAEARVEPDDEPARPVI